MIARPGVGGEIATTAVAALGSNVVNNLPMTVVFLEPLAVAPDRVWAVVIGVNLGPLLWATGALSTLLWQATMSELGAPVSARRYAGVGVRVGAPALVAAVVVSLLVG